MEEPGSMSSEDSMMGLIDTALTEIRSKFKIEFGSARSLTEPILAFVHAVDWTEPWLVGLLAFHFLLLLFVIKSRKNTGLQMATFLLGMLGVFFAERLNAFLGHRWRSFARQPYFDKHGVFMSTLWSGPLLLITSLILVNSLFTLTSLMVKWKRAELKYRARLAQQKAE